MFGKNKGELAQLRRKNTELQNQIEENQRRFDHALKTLRVQFSALLRGIPPTAASVLNGLPYNEIPKEQVLNFLGSVPELLILDVRSDEGWNNGYIPKAKHIPANQVFPRLHEIPDKNRPILTVCANGNTAVGIAQLLAKEGYTMVYNALGGMAGYTGELVKPELKPLDINSIQGVDRELIVRVLQVLDRDVRPGLQRDGGDLTVLGIDNGVVKIKMTGACTGCGALKQTVNEGIKNHLMKMIPEIKGIEDHT